MRATSIERSQPVLDDDAAARVAREARGRAMGDVLGGRGAGEEGEEGEQEEDAMDSQDAANKLRRRRAKRSEGGRSAPCAVTTA